MHVELHFFFRKFTISAFSFVIYKLDVIFSQFAWTQLFLRLLFVCLRLQYMHKYKETEKHAFIFIFVPPIHLSWNTQEYEISILTWLENRVKLPESVLIIQTKNFGDLL